MITLAGIRIIAAFVLAYLLPAFLRNRRCPEPGEGWVRLVHGFALTAACLEAVSLILAQRGLAVTNIAYADVGANTLGLVIHVHKDTLEKNPKLVQGFIHATQKAIAHTEKNPDEAIAALAKIKPDLDKVLAMQQLKAGLTLVRATGGTSQPIGWMNPADWDGTLRMAREFQELSTDMKPVDFYTNKLAVAK